MAAGAPPEASPLEVCHTIAEHLEGTAVVDDAGGLCWLDIDIPSQFPAPLLTDDGLCAGNAGVAVFVAALAAATGETRWADLAARAVAGDPPPADAALYSGAAGRGYGLVLVGALLDDAAIVARGVALLRTVPPAGVADVKPLDLLFGLPGIAGALAAAALTTGDDAMAVAAGDYADAVRAAWTAATRGGMRERLEAHRIGVAHGITGIELALARVHQVTGDASLVSLVAEMIEAENERVDRRGGIPARLNAVDRSPDRGWCWGAAGYVMAREVIAEATDLASARHAVDQGRSIARDGAGPIDRLCCGRAGQADVLGPGNAQLEELVGRPLRWRFEGEAKHQNASLLRGVSGVGLALLRSSAPESPQPLRLDAVAWR